MSASDPLQTAWDALERGGWEPRGQPHDFYSRCPCHNGDGHSLHVTVGGDGRALLHCFAHECAVEDIAAPAGITVADLFPPGHHKARRRRLPQARRAEIPDTVRTVTNVLAALGELGGDWYCEVRIDCPHCGAPGAILQASGRFTTYRCPGDRDAEELGVWVCTLDQALQALAARVQDHHDRKEAA